MIIKPKIRGFICTTAHPVGCAEVVKREIDYVKAQKPIEDCPKRVLVIGSSMGYGLASRIALAFGSKADTLGVMYDKPPQGNRTGTAGWYNTEAFEECAKDAGLYAKTVNGDAFSPDIKDMVIDVIKKDWGTCDMVIYSLAAPRRSLYDSEDGESDTIVSSVLKTIGEDYTNKTINLQTGEITKVTVTPATDEEIENTVKVMGGEDWEAWIESLSDAGVLDPKAVTIAYSYIGPELTHPLYKNGTIGKAKENLIETAKKLESEMSGISAFVAVNKALVTQSSSAIPIVPLYISVLFKVMKEKGCHEGTIEQMYRLFADKLFSSDGEISTDENGLIRMDDYEMSPDIQAEVAAIWEMINTDNAKELADIKGYQHDFLELFGFDVPLVDYNAEV
ncbi:MAG: trans-2-enoyl-CoA reductase family protein [Ruminococcus sp.]|jgi:enoyl-[acyl-carrier protein] reductase/trans-2-enoyl-CoA reductase (NAD+)|nr:trans-2-enoyl-CoA reductase family protein [Ruminococcus sp.]